MTAATRARTRPKLMPLLLAAHSVSSHGRATPACTSTPWCTQTTRAGWHGKIVLRAAAGQQHAPGKKDHGHAAAGAVAPTATRTNRSRFKKRDWGQAGRHTYVVKTCNTEVQGSVGICRWTRRSATNLCPPATYAIRMLVSFVPILGRWMELGAYRIGSGHIRAFYLVLPTGCCCCITVESNHLPYEVETTREIRRSSSRRLSLQFAPCRLLPDRCS
jgi:hypothetical protein